jgi:PAS domain S-box-containing protein
MLGNSSFAARRKRYQVLPARAVDALLTKGYGMIAVERPRIWTERSTWWGFLRIWLPLALITALAALAIYQVESNHIRKRTQATERNLVDLAAQALILEIVTAASDLRYLAHEYALREWLATGSPDARAQLAADLLAFVSNKKIYDQVRYIDASGKEMVRVNWSAGHPDAVPERQLQNKADRYYVRETLNQPQGRIYVSPLDLNVEKGRVEQPPKPMIRLGMPVHDPDGHLRGMAVLNLFGQRLLDRVDEIGRQAAGSLWLINADGYWLRGPHPPEEFGFMYSHGEAKRFQQRYPEAWASMPRSQKQGQLISGGGLFTYARVSPQNALDPGRTGLSDDEWIVLSYVPETALAAQIAGVTNGLALALAGVLLLTALAAAGTARSNARHRHLEQALQESGTRFRRLVESAPDGVVIADTEGRIVLANAQTEALFGYSRDEIVGNPVEMLIPERYRQGHVGMRKGYTAHPRTRPMGEGLELYGRRKDGSEFPVSISLSPIQTGPEMHIFGDIRDITFQRQAQERIQELNDSLARHNTELKVINQELEAFSYSVSHDLRSPLRAIDGFSRILIGEHAGQLDEKGRDRLERVRQAAQHMGALIDDLLKLSRVTRADLQFQDLDLSALAAEAADALQKQEPARNVQVSVASGLKATGDPKLLRIALDNLLGNAWKFTGLQEEARIEFGMGMQNGESVYYVRDNGAGFDMAYADKLFGAFQRLHDTGEFPGTGIGLATVQRIIHKHGGRIWAEGTVGQGATFYFTLAQRSEA